MALTFLVHAYRLASVLAILQTGAGVAAMYLYSSEPGADDIMVMLVHPIVNGLMTLYWVYRLSSYTRRADTTVYSRVHFHYRLLLNFSLGVWGVLGIAMNWIQFYVMPAATATCLADAFMHWQCIPLALCLTLPFALAITLFSASHILRKRALAIYGAEKVAMPAPIPRPWLYWDQQVPAWRTPHLAEFERPIFLEEGVESEKTDVKSAL